MTFRMEESKLDVLFPANMGLDRTGRITQCGPSIRHHLGHDPVGQALSQYFNLKKVDPSPGRPMPATMRQVVLSGKGDADGLLLRGSASLKRNHVLLFVSHAPVGVGKNASRRSLRFEDFSPSDSSIDMMIGLQLQAVLLQEARELSRELGHKTKLADAANVAKTRFLATMSHELRTPLNGILGMAQVLSGRDLTERNAEMVDIILASGEALLTILNDVLDISRVEAGRMSVEATDSDFVEAVCRIAALHSASAHQKGIALTKTIDPGFPDLIHLDAHKAGQCVSNVIGNAVKFTRSGSVHVRLSSEPSPTGYDVRIEVEDTGIGMTKAEQELIFEPFTQVDASTTRIYGGSGLGLSISRRLATLLGGSLTVESIKGEGSTFRLTFPAGFATATGERENQAA